MRTIDADAMKAEVESLDAESNNRIYKCAMEDMLEFFIELIDKQPTIEAEPVIHCNDCAFWESKRVSCEGLARCRTGESGYRYRFGHDFCSRAQKRDEVSEDETD